MSGFTFHPKKESVIFFVGFLCIAGIIGFYGRAYFRSKAPQAAPVTKLDTSSITDDMYISYDTLVQKRRESASNTIFIDIRPNDFFAFEHIPQSTNIPIEVIDSLTIKDGFNFVLIAQAGNERGLAATAAQVLKNKNGKAPIFILNGGFEGWKNSGGQTISFGNPESITDHSKVNYVTPEELKKRLDARQSYFVLDMRPKDIYDQGHVQGAVNLPLDQLEKFSEKIPAGARIITYGNSELEDFQAGVRLFDLGFFSTEVLKGGYAGWKAKGFDTQPKEVK